MYHSMSLSSKRIPNFGEVPEFFIVTTSAFCSEGLTTSLLAGFLLFITIRVLSFHSFFALLHILLKILRTQPDQPSQCSAFFLDIQTNWHSLKLNFFRFHCIPNYKLTYQYHQIYPCHHPTLRINQSISMEINLFPRIERSKRCQTSTPLTIVKIKLLI